MPERTRLTLLSAIAALSLPWVGCGGASSGDGGGGAVGTAGSVSSGTGGSAGLATAGTGVGGTPQAGNGPQAGTPSTAGTSSAGAPTAGTTGVSGSGGTTGTGGTSTGGKGGTTSTAGTAGTGGAPIVCNPSTATGLIGWATQGGGVTGGGNAAATTATSASALSSALSGTTARVVRFSGTISISTLEIGSNKTLEGMGNNATINGGILLDGSSNVIIRNIRVNAASSGAGDDGIQLQGATRVWIDHCEIYDAPDGNLDITDASDYVTVSWTKFRYSAAGDHNFSNLVGGDDGDTGDTGHNRVTFHHNWWADRVMERMPRVRFGQVHIFNNYYSAQGNDHCVRAAFRSNVRVENNYYDMTRTPHEIAEDQNTAVLTAAGNFYNLSLNTGGNPASRGTAFTPPYQFTLEPGECMKQIVMANAGPR